MSPPPRCGAGPTWSSCATRRPATTELLASAARLRELCDQAGALLWVNDRPDLALAAEADGVHVGQDDMPVADARAEVGDDLLVGLSTHSPDQLAAALDSGADELSVGPVWATPTKEGRPAAGLEYVSHAASVAGDRPWFAIGGIDSRQPERGARRGSDAGGGGAGDPRSRRSRGGGAGVARPPGLISDALPFGR